MKKPRLQGLLMLITILGVTGFQIFWLRQSYDREKKALALKTDFSFREAILRLQADHFKLNAKPGDSMPLRKIRIVGGDRVSQELNIQTGERRAMVSTVNLVRRKMSDSIQPIRQQILINHNGNRYDLRKENGESNMPKEIVQVLYGMDSLQTPLTVDEITAATKRLLEEQKIHIPFSIAKADNAYHSPDAMLNEMTVGFKDPVTYKFIPGNTTLYILRKLSLPLLFSFLLLGIMIAAFLLLYRNLQKQRRLTEIKNEFIANITHELKTPIATVGVAIEALKDFDGMKDPARAKEYLGIAGDELHRLSLLVDKVLRQSMFENKAIELKKESIDLAAVLQEVKRSMQPLFEKTNAEVITELKGTDLSINADRIHIAGVIYNLLDNAIKYSNGSPKIVINVDASPNEILLKVRDHGIGIDPVYRNKIFEKFFRVPQGNIHNVKGYGLGLSYAAHITEQHGGNIRAEAAEGGGTTFIIKLPRNNVR